MPLPSDGLEAQKILRELLDYDPVTGFLTWKVRDLKWFTSKAHMVRWNKCFAGQQALNNQLASGYLRGKVLSKSYRTHRIIWVWMTGVWPDQIDHDDGVEYNNVWDNLFDKSHTDNQRNRAKFKNNTSGYTGVSFINNRKAYRSTICINGKNKELGLFPTAEEAAQARAIANIQQGYHPNHGRSICQPF